MRRAYLPAILTAWLLGGAPAAAQQAFPMLMGTAPLAVRRGVPSEVEVSSRHSMAGATEIFCEPDDLRGTPLLPAEMPAAKPTEAKPTEAKPAEKPDEAKSTKKPVDLTKLKIRFEAPADAPPGPRDYRLLTPLGPSTLGQVVIVQDPIFTEKGDNDTPAKALPLTLPAVACGALEKKEDADFWKFTAKAGEQIVFHVWCARLQDRIHDLQMHADPLISVRNAQGVVLAANDNRFYADSFLQHRFAADGEYFLEVRDVRYEGNPFWQYAVEIHTRPFVAAVLPSALRPGAETSVELHGFGLPDNARTTLTLPAGADGPRTLVPRMGNVDLNPIPVRATPYPVTVEAPLDGGAIPAFPTLPAIVCGRLAAEGEIDRYRFSAKKGDRRNFEVFARRYGSDLDPVLRILDAAGKRLVENDDAPFGRVASADSSLADWVAPKDGDYLLEISDLHQRGGPGFLYALQGTVAEPRFLLEIDTDKTALAPGLAAPLFVRAYRQGGFTGAIELTAEGLPPGVTAVSAAILPENKDGTIILQAAADAAPLAGNIRVRGSAVMPAGAPPPTCEAAVLQEIYMPGGGRGHFPASMHTVGIVPSLDLKSIRIEPAVVRLRPGTSQRVEVRIERSPGFDKNVTLDAIFRHLNSVYGSCLPAGVTLDPKKSKTLIVAKETVGYLTFQAAPDAKPIADYPLPIMAHTAINFVMKSNNCAEPLRLSVVADEPAPGK